jgi:hypothetical protein
MKRICKRLFILVPMLLLVNFKLMAGEKALLVITELDHHGVSELESLYRKLEVLAWKVPSETPAILENYAVRRLLQNEQATVQGIGDLLVETLADAQIDKVDMVLAVHGMPGTLTFYDGKIRVENLASDLTDRIHRELGESVLGKLGFIYNLSRYGESHNSSFLKMGFQVAIGSRKVNANAELEYPWVLRVLGAGKTIDQAFTKPNSPGWLKTADGPVRWLGQKQNNFLKDTDSYKIISGDRQYKIYMP